MILLDIRPARIRIKAQRNGGKIVMVGVPTKRSREVHFDLMTMANHWANQPNAFSYFVADAYCSAGRNRLVDFALDKIPEVTHIYFVDADTVPKRSSLKKLLEMDKDVAVAPTIMTIDDKLFWNVVPDIKDVSEFGYIPYGELPGKPFRIFGGGCSAVLVKRKVLEALEWPYFKDVFKQSGRILGQDTYFMAKVKDAGFEIWCNPALECEHYHNVGLLKLAKKNFNKGE